MIGKRKESNEISRRTFLQWAWAASLFGLFGQAGGALFSFLKPRVEPGAFGAIVVAGQVNEFVPGTVNHIQQGRFFLSRLEDGSFLAIWHRCTHLGCTVPWREAEGQFNCPCHSSIFSAAGDVISGPAPRPMDIFPIEIKDGQVLVDTGNPIQRNDFDPAQVTFA